MEPNNSDYYMFFHDFFIIFTYLKNTFLLASKSYVHIIIVMLSKNGLSDLSTDL